MNNGVKVFLKSLANMAASGRHFSWPLGTEVGYAYWFLQCLILGEQDLKLRTIHWLVDDVDDAQLGQNIFESYLQIWPTLVDIFLDLWAGRLGMHIGCCNAYNLRATRLEAINRPLTWRWCRWCTMGSEYFWSHLQRWLPLVAIFLDLFG